MAANTKAASPREICLELNTLLGQSGDLIVRRLKLGKALLENHEWVDAPDGGGGNENKALIRLEGLYFGDIVGLHDLTELFDLLHHFPNIADWRKARFNLKRMVALVREKNPPKQIQRRDFSTPRNGLVPPLSFPELSDAEKRKEFGKAFDLTERFKESMESWRSRAEKAEAELATVKAENAQLRRQLSKVEAVFARTA